MPNIAAFVVVYLALNRINAIPVMALRAHRHAEVRHFLRASGAVAYVIADVVGSFDYRSMAAEMQREFDSLAHVIVVGVAGPDQIGIDELVTRFGKDVPGLASLHVDPSSISTMLLSGRHDVDVEADPAHPRRLRAQRAPVRRGGRLRRTDGVFSRCCRSATTTTSLRRGCSGRSITEARSWSHRHPIPTPSSASSNASA